MQEIFAHRFTDLNKLSIPFSFGGYRGEFLYWGYFSAEYWRNYLHVHSFFEICYAFQGSGTFRLDDQTTVVKAGEVFVAKPGEVHEILSSQSDPLGIYFWAFTLFPHQPALTSSDSNYRLIESETQQVSVATEIAIDQLLSDFCNADCFVSDNTNTLFHLLQGLTTEVTLLQPGYLHSIRNLAENLVLETARSISPATANSSLQSETNDEMVGKIVRYLKDNYARPIQLRDVAAQLHLSERHTSRIFRNKMGMPILEYLTALRISVAKQQLLNPTLSIAEVARSIGYDDNRHFSTLFRHHTGLTPTSFRKLHGTEFLLE